jgi:sodium/potassium-transporting ATPase subunit alpha
VDLPVLVERLETDLKNGLTSTKATEKLTTIGRNVLSERKKTPWYVKLIHEYTSFFA